MAGTLGAALNIGPILKVLAYIVGIGIILYVLFWIGFFLLLLAKSVVNFVSGKDDETGEFIVFWGGIAIVIALIVLAFTEHIVTIE